MEILNFIGNSPLVSLQNIVSPSDGEVLVKLEKTNPGGSIKDRPALYIVEEAEKRGWVKPGGTLIESSSGNFGISLAMIGAIKGYQVIILVDPKTTPVNLAMLKAFGAKVIVVTEQDDSGSYHKTRIALANKLHREIPNSFRPDQCFNLLNGEAHYKSTAQELFDQSAGDLNAVVLSVSTGGQLGGVSRYFREHLPNAQVIAVDAVGSTVFGGNAHPYLLPGMGLSWTPTNIDDLTRIDQVFKVPDGLAFMMCRVLARHEGVLCGGSTGAAVAAAMHLVQKHGSGYRVACIASDNGERYLPTIYNDEWLIERNLTTSVEVSEIRALTAEMEAYSTNPIGTANYKPELAELLDSPTHQLA